MSLVIRKVNEEDYPQIENLTREAFWNVYRPGCVEHLVINKIHKMKKSISELELVAEYNHKIVGHIAYTRGGIKGVDNDSFITFGPVSVMPELQHKNIGSKLIRISLQKAARLGFTAVFITGDENYYRRFCFESASKYDVHMEGVSMEDEAPFFMVRVLKEDALAGVSGYFDFDECYNVTDEEVEEFDNNFAPKKKEFREGQLDF